MKLFFKCNLFEDETFVANDKFIITQNELIMSSVVNKTDVSFKKKLVEYQCDWFKQDDWSTRPTILIPIKDNLDLLTYTISNLKEHKIDTHCNIIVIDDRSSENIKDTVINNGLSYLRVDNEKGFNFSMLNNIPAKICYDLGIETIILWNSDLWCVKEEWFLELLKRHNEDNSVLSGTKLVYPPEEMSLREEKDTKNIKDNFMYMSDGKWRETIQFGGAAWIHTRGPILYSPIHAKRFGDITNPFSNFNKPITFMTGALHIWDLKTFLDVGGLNPSLSKNFQDVDICLKLIENNKAPMYYGKDLFFYHDESATMNNLSNEVKNDAQMISDHYLFGKIWNKKIASLIF
ncbi:MAG: glycosyltransferase family 2 protein [Candidatus Hodarchaeales archaeon]|jgi:GT2 family glycosyltransferase